MRMGDLGVVENIWFSVVVAVGWWASVYASCLGRECLDKWCCITSEI